MQKRIGFIFGGKSVEHDVSLQSARNVIRALDTKKYTPIPIGITKNGVWLNAHESFELLSDRELGRRQDPTKHRFIENIGTRLKKHQTDIGIDVIFPLVHGTFGEDGTLQGFARLLDIPYVGADILGSAIGIDKDVTKRLLRDSGLPIVDFMTVRRDDCTERLFNHCKKTLGIPFFFKPARLGSSVGVSKVRDSASFFQAVRIAGTYDDKFLIERFIKGREVECAVLGNNKPCVSAIGEITTTDDYYTYRAKYIDKNATQLHIPAQINKKTVKKIQDIALQAYSSLCCSGMARVDFFLTEHNQIYINEINTIPGFTSVSMYPKLWEYSGVAYSSLISRLIELAIERHKNEFKLKKLFHSKV